MAGRRAHLRDIRLPEFGLPTVEPQIPRELSCGTCSRGAQTGAAQGPRRARGLRRPRTCRQHRLSLGLRSALRRGGSDPGAEARAAPADRQRGLGLRGAGGGPLRAGALSAVEPDGSAARQAEAAAAAVPGCRPRAGHATSARRAGKASTRATAASIPTGWKSPRGSPTAYGSSPDAAAGSSTWPTSS